MFEKPKVETRIDKKLIIKMVKVLFFVLIVFKSEYAEDIAVEKIDIKRKNW